MVRFTPRPFYPWGKSLRCPLDSRLDGPPDPVWMLWIEKHSCTFWEWNAVRPAHCYSDWVIPAQEISLLTCILEVAGLFLGLDTQWSWLRFSVVSLGSSRAVLPHIRSWLLPSTFLTIPYSLYHPVIEHNTALLNKLEVRAPHFVVCCIHYALRDMEFIIDFRGAYVNMEYFHQFWVSWNIINYNFAVGSLWIWKLVSGIKGGT
jgi:hypothetical protein